MKIGSGIISVINSIAIVGVVLNAPVIHKQANRCKCSNFLPAVMSSTLGHHTTAAYVSEGLIIAVYIHRATLGVKPQVLPTVSLTDERISVLYCILLQHEASS